MTAQSFNAGWTYRPPLGPFAATQGTQVTRTPVVLPHDALRDADRSPDAPGTGAGACCPRAPVIVEVYADAEEVALVRDGAEVARARIGDAKPMLAVLETTYSPGELVAVAYRDGRAVGQTSLATAGPARLTAYADRTTLRADDRDLAFVAIELRDAGGQLVAGPDTVVTVKVSGVAMLAGMCSANPRTTERFDADTWRTFDGRAVAVVRPTAEGAATVVISAADQEPVTIGLEVTS
jgi:hypothetical protein